MRTLEILDVGVLGHMLFAVAVAGETLVTVLAVVRVPAAVHCRVAPHVAMGTERLVAHWAADFALRVEWWRYL